MARIMVQDDIDTLLDHGIIASMENGEQLKPSSLPDQKGVGNLMVNEILGRKADDCIMKPLSQEESEQLELENQAHLGLLSKKQRYMLHKRMLRQNPKYKQEEQERSRERMKLKRNDPDYREAERLRDRKRRQRARENNLEQRTREKERDRQYKQRIRQTNLQVVREEIVLNTEGISETNTFTNSSTHFYAQRGVTSCEAVDNLTLTSSESSNASQPLVVEGNVNPGEVVLLHDVPQSFIVCSQTNLPVLEI